MPKRQMPDLTKDWIFEALALQKHDDMVWNATSADKHIPPAAGYDLKVNTTRGAPSLLRELAQEALW